MYLLVSIDRVLNIINIQLCKSINLQAFGVKYCLPGSDKCKKNKDITACYITLSGTLWKSMWDCLACLLIEPVTPVCGNKTLSSWYLNSSAIFTIDCFSWWSQAPELSTLPIPVPFSWMALAFLGVSASDIYLPRSQWDVFHDLKAQDSTWL